MEPREVIERSILAAAFQGHQIIDQIACLVSDGDFSSPGCRTAWRALQRLSAAGSPVDPVAVHEEMCRSGSATTIASVSFLAELADQRYEAAHAEHYCGILKRYATAEAAQDLGRRLASETQIDDAILDSYIVRLDGIRSVKTGDIATMAESVAQLRDRQANPLGVHKTGLHSLDFRLAGGGIKDGQLIVVGGRPGTGKSVLMAQIAMEAARGGTGAVIVSLEMPRDEIAGRFLATIPEPELVGVPVHIIDTTSDLGTICALLKVACRRHNIGVIVVDYLQLAEVAISRNENRERQVATISRRLKRLAMDLRKPLIVGSQLNRESARKGKPTLADLRESGAVEQDADIVMLLHKPDDSDDADETVLDVAKQRGGGTGEIRLILDGPRFVFRDKFEHSEPFTGRL